jgi:hypothetical protein
MKIQLRGALEGLFARGSRRKAYTPAAVPQDRGIPFFLVSWNSLDISQILFRTTLIFRGV